MKSFTNYLAAVRARHTGYCRYRLSIIFNVIWCCETYRISLLLTLLGELDHTRFIRTTIVYRKMMLINLSDSVSQTIATATRSYFTHDKDQSSPQCQLETDQSHYIWPIMAHCKNILKTSWQTEVVILQAWLAGRSSFSIACSSYLSSVDSCALTFFLDRVAANLASLEIMGAMQ